MHPVCLMSKPLLPCFVTIVLLIVSCTHCWVVTLGDMELLSSDLQNQAPVKFWKVLMVLPVFRVSTNWNISSLLIVWWCYCYCFAFLLYPLVSFGTPFNLEATTWGKLRSSPERPVCKAARRSSCENRPGCIEFKHLLDVGKKALLGGWRLICVHLTWGHPKFSLFFFFWDGCDKNHQKL